jgi:hypothetical protein
MGRVVFPLYPAEVVYMILPPPPTSSSSLLARKQIKFMTEPVFPSFLPISPKLLEVLQFLQLSASQSWIIFHLFCVPQPAGIRSLATDLEVHKYASKACQRLLGPNAVTAQVRLAKYVIKGSLGFSIFVPGDLHTNNLGDFLAVCYTCPPQPASSLAGCRLDC